MGEDEPQIDMDPEDSSLIELIRNPERVPSPEGDTPEWFTNMDQQILYAMNFGLILNPAIIAENIDRSRGAVSRRLQTLRAGGYVDRVGRGKYLITEKGSYTVTGDPYLNEQAEE